MIEQLSLFEAGNTVDSEQIRKYLPNYNSEYKPTVASAAAFNYTQEREILFKMLFKMQNEIEELRSQIEGMPQTPHHTEVRAEEIPAPESHSLIRYPGFKKNLMPSDLDYHDVEEEIHAIDITLLLVNELFSVVNCFRITLPSALTRNKPEVLVPNHFLLEPSTAMQVTGVSFNK